MFNKKWNLEKLNKLLGKFYERKNMNRNLEEKKKLQGPTWSSNIDWDGLTDQLFINNHKPSWNYCDVGSCQGRFTYLFVNLSKPGGKVYAFEINENNPTIPETIFEKIAISDFVGTEKFYECGSHMSNILGHDVGYNETPFKSEIPCTTLDAYFKDKPLDCIKIDIEGAELKAIKGGLETLKKCKLVVIECHLDADWLDIYNVLNENGFKFKNLANNEPIIEGQRPYIIYYIND